MALILSDLSRDKLTAFCRRWQITELAVFGSARRDDFHPESDVDVLVTFAADAHWGLFDLVAMQAELRVMVGREVDLVDRRAVEKSENYIRRRHILESAVPLYVETDIVREVVERDIPALIPLFEPLLPPE